MFRFLLELNFALGSLVSVRAVTWFFAAVMELLHLFVLAILTFNIILK